MTSTSTVREWSTPEKTKVTGQPPGPDMKVSHTSRGEFRRQDLQMVTPIYKTDSFSVGLPVGASSLHIKSESRLEPITGQTYPDYKVEKEKDLYRLHIIDPKVDPHSTTPNIQNLSSYLKKRNKTPDFPSAHTKRSFLKLDPLEIRRLKSYETKIISPHEYLNESVERHRSVSMSPLRDRLNVRERDVNLPWDPSAHPGPKRDEQWPKTQISRNYIKKQEIFNDLNELAKRRERLLDRSKNRSSSNIRELRKVDPDYVDLPEREYFEESRSSKSSGRDLIRSHSMMSTEWDMYDKHTTKTRSQMNLASWQFNNASFSPRSVISVNGHQSDTGLLRIRTDLSPAPARIVIQQPVQPPPVHKSNAAVQTLTKTEHVSTTLPQPAPQPQFWPYPSGTMPQVVLVPIAATTTTTGSAANTLTREVKEEKQQKFAYRDFDRYPSDTDSKQGTLIRIKDEAAKKPKPIIKHHRKKEIVRKEENWEEKENRTVDDRENNRFEERQAPADTAVVTPQVTETVSTVEETKRTEEIERKVRAENKRERKERRKKKTTSGGSGSRERNHQQHLTYYDQQGGGQAIDYPPWTVPFGESKQSPWRQQQAAITSNGYNPSVTESYHKQTTTKRVKDTGSDGSFRSRQTGKHGQDDSHHFTNGAYREGYRENETRERMHKSHSSSNVFHNELPENYGDHQHQRPIVEYPPSLQRGGDDRYYNQHGARHLGRYGRRWESEMMTGPERDYRDSLLMPMPPPGRNVDEREYRQEVIPGGHETFSRETKSHAGSRNDANSVTHFSQAKQDVSFRREQAADRRY